MQSVDRSPTRCRYLGFMDHRIAITNVRFGSGLASYPAQNLPISVDGQVWATQDKQEFHFNWHEGWHWEWRAHGSRNLANFTLEADFIAVPSAGPSLPYQGITPLLTLHHVTGKFLGPLVVDFDRKIEKQVDEGYFSIPYSVATIWPEAKRLRLSRPEITDVSPHQIEIQAPLGPVWEDIHCPVGEVLYNIGGDFKCQNPL